MNAKDLERVRTVFCSIPAIERVRLYGSRAKGNFNTYSDIDITLQGDQLDLETQYQLDLALDELYLPYIIDISILSHIKNPDLLKHIEHVGVLLYEKEL